MARSYSDERGDAAAPPARRGTWSAPPDDEGPPRRFSLAPEDEAGRGGRLQERAAHGE